MAGKREGGEEGREKENERGKEGNKIQTKTCHAFLTALIEEFSTISSVPRWRQCHRALFSSIKTPLQVIVRS